MKRFKMIGLALVAVLAGGALYWWYHEGLIHPSTDDAYLQANILSIAPQVGGRVTQVAATENGYVHKGDVLFQIDPAMLQAAVDTAQANVDQAQRTAGSTGADVSAAQARLSGVQAALSDAQTAFDRQKTLLDKADVSQAALDQATNALDQAKAAQAEAEAALVAARTQAGKSGDGNALVRAAKGMLMQAQIDLGHATVTAPADGWIANISLRPGQVVGEGKPLFSLVEDATWWVDGNFKETDLKRIRTGQPVTIDIDMYPGVTLTGRVESIGAGSGAVFSLLPPENATGNWVKVTQRFPVRIAFDTEPTDPQTPLRVGASVTAKVDTSALDAQ